METVRETEIIDDDNVRILVMDPMSYGGKAVYKFNTSRQLLEKHSEVFKGWFKSIDLYKDYIEIGDQGVPGSTNIMLFYKNDQTPYLITINCEYYTHKLGMLHPPIISDVLNHINGIQSHTKEINRAILLEDCLNFLKISDKIKNE